LFMVPVVSQEADSCRGRALMFQRMILHGGIRDALPLERSWLDSAVLATSATLAVVGVDKVKTKGPLQ
jgi:hypothetical protein